MLSWFYASEFLRHEIGFIILVISPFFWTKVCQGNDVEFFNKKYFWPPGSLTLIHFLWPTLKSNVYKYVANSIIIWWLTLGEITQHAAHKLWMQVPWVQGYRNRYDIIQQYWPRFQATVGKVDWVLMGF